MLCPLFYRSNKRFQKKNYRYLNFLQLGPYFANMRGEKDG